MIYGIGATILSFAIISGLSLFVNNLGWIRALGNFDEKVYLSTFQIMAFASATCATDSVAALTIISAEKYPKLFIVVFGEGTLNDAVAIIIFQTVKNLVGGNQKFYWYTTLEIVG